MRLPGFFFVALALCGTATAQQSSGFRLTEGVWNAGGNPADGTVLTSTRFRVTLDGIGWSLAGTSSASASHRLDGALTHAYPPPGEVLGLDFEDAETLVWSPERSAAVYHVYRDDLRNLEPGGYGVCWQPAVIDPTTSDTDVPSVLQVWFYLVTAENLLAEEGTKGYDGYGEERPNPAPCP